MERIEMAKNKHICSSKKLDCKTAYALGFVGGLRHRIEFIANRFNDDNRLDLLSDRLLELASDCEEFARASK
jgi:hypothetical protein